MKANAVSTAKTVPAASKRLARAPVSESSVAGKKVSTSAKPASLGVTPPAPAAPVSPSKAPPTPPSEKPAKTPKVRLVRDSFTMPEADVALLAVLKARALGLGRATKKSELLRAGLQLLNQQDPKVLMASLERLQPIKTGRPKRGD